MKDEKTEYYYKYEDDKYEGLKIAYEVFYKMEKKEVKYYGYHEYNCRNLLLKYNFFGQKWKKIR